MCDGFWVESSFFIALVISKTTVFLTGWFRVWLDVKMTSKLFGMRLKWSLVMMMIGWAHIEWNFKLFGLSTFCLHLWKLQIQLLSSWGQVIKPSAHYDLWIIIHGYDWNFKVMLKKIERKKERHALLRFNHCCLIID